MGVPGLGPDDQISLDGNASFLAQALLPRGQPPI
jgi:hypothetical protein